MSGVFGNIKLYASAKIYLMEISYYLVIIKLDSLQRYQYFNLICVVLFILVNENISSSPSALSDTLLFQRM